MPKYACDSCGSSDGVTRYEDHTTCYVCQKQVWFNAGEGPTGSPAYTPTRNEMTGFIDKIADRKLTKETCKKYGITQELGPDGQITKHYYPYFNVETGEQTATKKRVCGEKIFPWSGDRTNIGLFGQQACKGRGKYITITEGELDAASVSQMFDNRWDVVSIRDGAQSASRAIKEQLQWLEGYDNIVLAFDNDKDGQKAVEDCKDLFSPQKLKVMTMPEGCKDPNQALVEGHQKLFVSAWWDAKTYQPAGIVKVSETWNQVLKYRDTPSIPYPWEGLNTLLMGQRRKEINIWAAETGIGKSQTMREIQDHLIMSTKDERVGCLMLEESIAKTTMGWMSFKAGRPLHKELNTIPDEELRKYWEMAVADDRLVLLDHKGWGNSMETLKARIRYMKHAMGCNTIILDHLHIALSSVHGASGDWAGIDELVTDFVGMVNELDICLHLVCHTSGERSLRGSKGISKLADAVIFLERDKHHEDPEVANTTAVIVDKNRWAGDSGVACYLRYDKATHRMTECEKPAALGETPDEF